MSEPTTAGFPVDAAEARTDRRSARTRAALREALIQLINEKGYDAITVGDLCERADITRGTFYNHYSDKDALLVACEDEIIAELEAIQARMNGLDLVQTTICVKRKKPIPLLVSLFDYLRSQAYFLGAVMGPQGDPRFERNLLTRVREILMGSVLHERYRKNPTPFVNYYVTFYASAYLGVVKEWIEPGMRESSEDMAVIAQRLLFIKAGESIKL